MTERTISVSEFKARCLALLEDISTSGDEIVVTKRGRPLARVVAIDEPPTLRGSVRYLVDDDELPAPIDARWNAS